MNSYDQWFSREVAARAIGGEHEPSLAIPGLVEALAYVAGSTGTVFGSAMDATRFSALPELARAVDAALRAYWDAGEHRALIYRKLARYQLADGYPMPDELAAEHAENDAARTAHEDWILMQPRPSTQLARWPVALEALHALHAAIARYLAVPAKRRPSFGAMFGAPQVEIDDALGDTPDVEDFADARFIPIGIDLGGNWTGVVVVSEELDAGRPAAVVWFHHEEPNRYVRVCDSAAEAAAIIDAAAARS